MSTDYEEENITIAEIFVGKTIKEVIDTNTGKWYAPLGVKIIFTDDSFLDISADMGQGGSYVILSDTE